MGITLMRCSYEKMKCFHHYHRLMMGTISWEYRTLLAYIDTDQQNKKHLMTDIFLNENSFQYFWDLVFHQTLKMPFMRTARHVVKTQIKDTDNWKLAQKGNTEGKMHSVFFYLN